MWSPFKKEQPKEEVKEQPNPEEAKKIVGDIFKGIDDTINFYKQSLTEVMGIQKEQSRLMVALSDKITALEKKIETLEIKIKQRENNPTYIG